MSSTADVLVPMIDSDEAFLPPVPAALIAARGAKRDYIVCLGVAMVTPVVMLCLGALIH